MKIGTLFNIEIYINKMLLVLVVIALLSKKGVEVLCIFIVIFLHEMSHVLMAKFLQLKVREIELLPFGGIVWIESLFELNPNHEMLLAIAGPFMNILLTLGYAAFEKMGFQFGEQGEFFMQMNLILAGFNLLPALPLDGGRILRAMLSREIGMKKATNIAANGGLILALFLLMTGLYALYLKSINLSLFLMAGFLTYSAMKEKRGAAYIFVRDITYKKEILLKEGALQTRQLVVLYDVPVKEVIKKFTPHRYHYIQVVDEKMVERGTLSESDIIRGIMDYGIHVPIVRLVRNISL